MPSVSPDEHVIKCNICGRSLIVKDNVNNSMAFLSHLKIDHDIFYILQQMTETKAEAKRRVDNSRQILDDNG
jgi:hypothetical protein